MFEILFELVGEFVLQALGQILVEFGFHFLAEPFRKTPNPWIAGVGYALFGALCGGISLIVFPDNLVVAAWRLANLAATPIAVGAVMVALGAWRAARGDVVLRIDRFAYGYLFSFALALVRFRFAH